MIVVCAFFLILTGFGSAALGYSPAEDQQQIPHQFRAHTEPSVHASIMGTFAPQYVSVIQRGQDDWIQISTWLGPGWVNLSAGAEYAYRFDLWGEEEISALTRMAWGETRGRPAIHTRMVVRTVINRLEANNPWYGHSILRITRDTNQFHGYRSHHPTPEYYRNAVIAELEAWSRGEPGVVYPPFSGCPHYRYFGARWHGARTYNFFRTHHWGNHCSLC